MGAIRRDGAGRTGRAGPGEFNEALMELGALICTPDRAGLPGLSGSAALPGLRARHRPACVPSRRPKPATPLLRRGRRGRAQMRQRRRAHRPTARRRACWADCGAFPAGRVATGRGPAGAVSRERCGSRPGMDRARARAVRPHGQARLHALSHHAARLHGARSRQARRRPLTCAEVRWVAVGGTRRRMHSR